MFSTFTSKFTWGKGCEKFPKSHCKEADVSGLEGYFPSSSLPQTLEITRTDTHRHTQILSPHIIDKQTLQLGAFSLKISRSSSIHWPTRGGPTARWLLCEVLQVLSRSKAKRGPPGVYRQSERVQVSRRAHLLPFLSCSGSQGPDLLPTYHRAPWPSSFQSGSADGMWGRWLLQTSPLIHSFALNRLIYLPSTTVRNYSMENS